MSLVGRKPIVVPSGTNVEIKDNVIEVKGSKGSLKRTFDKSLSVVHKDGFVLVNRNGDTSEQKAAHGLWRSLINNMVIGVSQGFEKQLSIIGTGYRAKQEGKNVSLNLGFSHLVDVTPYKDNELKVEKDGTLFVRGINKENVGEQAARIRKLRKPNPYTGKGIKYSDEVVKRKAGKSAKEAG